jgi:multiple sugar transport system permease protein
MARLGSFLSPKRQMIYWGSGLFLLACTFPFFWMVSTSFKPLREIFVFPPYFFPKQFTLASFEKLFTQTNFIRYFRNSVYVSSSATLLTMLVSCGGAYSLTRFQYFGREKIASLILFTYMFAPIMIVIPICPSS